MVTDGYWSFFLIISDNIDIWRVKDKMYKQGGFRNFAPVNVGDELDVTIDAIGGKGDGIAKIKGFVIFVPNVKQDEHVKIRITKVLRKVGFGEVIGQGSPGEDSDHNEGRKNHEKIMDEDSDMDETSDVDDSIDEVEQTDTEDFGDEV